MFPRKFLYAAAIFLSSCLLFLIEPMAGKRILPLLGGSAAVWITCLVFFQTTLLLGYLFAHGLATRLRPSRQAIAYLMLLAVCMVTLRRSTHPDLHATTARPILSVLWLLTTLIGLPFLALSASSPLLQAWYASQRGTSAQPYRLFALSNFGSLLALLVYPWLIEPRFSLHTQSVAWAVGFVIFAAICAGIELQFGNASANAQQTATDSSTDMRPSGSARVLWLLLPACGSLLLSAVTNHLSQNIAAIPLLWIIPLVVYLFSFVVAFNGEKFYPRLVMLCATPLILGGIGYLLYQTRFTINVKLSIALFCLGLFILCWFCHAELYRLRPAARYATSFYLLIAAGGALGAFFVGVLAPMIFSGNYELPCGLVFAAVMGLFVAWNRGIVFRIWWPITIVGMVVLAVMLFRNDRKDTILQVRSFYGVLTVTETHEPPEASFTRTLYHGTIEHGTQIFSPELRTTPTTYYATDSGVGMALTLCCGERPRRVGIIGLGTGTLAAYGRKGDVFRFYEINPLVERIAHGDFTYLRESAAQIEIVPGDARLSLATEPSQNYDVLVVDAFSGDAIPVHLLTTQAFELYRRQMTPNGILAFHVSNQFLDLPPEVKQQAEHAGLQTAFIVADDDPDKGEYSSDWVLVTNNAEFLSQSNVAIAEKGITIPTGLRLWTDDYNSLLPLLKKEPLWKKDE
jgi:hypothetical protein